MYSANGRQKQTKETATVKTHSVVLVCNKCGYEKEGASKVFGEVLKCPKCGSSEVLLLNRIN